VEPAEAANAQEAGGKAGIERPGRHGSPIENGSIYESIREGILTGRYAPGERLIEARLAEEFGVSRTRIRDALARLHTDHMVAPAPNRGLVVRPLSSRDIEEIYALRLLLEGFAVNAAAANITTRELDQLYALHNRMLEVEQSVMAGQSDEERLASIRTVTDINNEIHRGIQRASRNRRLESLLRTIVSLPLVFQSFYWYSDRELAESSREHAEILEALKERDGVLAESLMRRHISRGFNTILRELPIS
jgi:DNA-binding GntR family transcriptional regulator